MQKSRKPAQWHPHYFSKNAHWLVRDCLIFVSVSALLGLLNSISFAQSTPSGLSQSWVWIEGEKTSESKVTRQPSWYDQVPKSAFSGGDFISHFNETDPGEVQYVFSAPKTGIFNLWLRANPNETTLDYRLNGGDWASIPTDKPIQKFTLVGWDMRFLAWIPAGYVSLKQGDNTIRFRFNGKPKPHGILDCFVFVEGEFVPYGIAKPNEANELRNTTKADENNWFDFAPGKDSFAAGSAIDLRGLNETFAGEHGRIAANNGQFVFSSTGNTVRFWAVNGPGHDAKPETLKNTAKMLAKHGINLVRVHGAVFDEKTGELNPEKPKKLAEIVAAMKAEGIYTHLSIYFPLWFKPQPGLSWLEGYDGNKNPFAALEFNEGFQKQWRGWWQAVLNTPMPDGKLLKDDPAVFGLEIQNEDSFFFWTFSADNIPDAQMKILEKMFGDWLAKKYGTLDKAQAAWGDAKNKRDNAAEGRAGFGALWEISSRKAVRDQDTAAFLLETQMNFYRNGVKALHDMGFPGMITCSNWATASPEVLGPMEKFSYTVGDFIDRHGYFGCRNSGLFSEWSIRDGHTYIDRSGLRFEAENPGAARQFNHPVIDIQYDDKPSMISETTWCRPNRYRTEAPLYFAAYGALQDSDAIVHFALDGADWSVKPNFWMQPWTVIAPSQMGQFPAAALIYRKGLVATGELLADIAYPLADMRALKGTPMPQDAAFDELRLKDVPAGTALKPGNRVDPLIHYAGRTRTRFTDTQAPSKLVDTSKLIDRKNNTVTSSTGELKLDYGRGILTINAPAAQGVSGDLRSAGKVTLKDVTIQSSLELGHIVLVALDDQALAKSKRMLLQAMSEEKATGFSVIPQGKINLIENIGKDPWRVRKLQGRISLSRSDALNLKVTALDANGYPIREVGNAAGFDLLANVVYYRIGE
jgi:hypothetical protein